MDDTGSLQNLNDIVIPGPVGWWPLAPGWYVLLGVMLLALALLAWLQLRRWRRNRYRREALAELTSIRGRASAGSLRHLPVLLKRAALSAWPREQVAALSGRPWHRFLDQGAGMDDFRQGAGDTLDQLAYGGESPPAARREEVLDAAETWLKRHNSPQQDD